MRISDWSSDVCSSDLHTCASRLADNGIDLVSLRDWLGHSDIKITAGRYVHRMNGHIHIGARILNAYNIGTHGTKGGKRIEDGETSSLRNHPSNGSERAESRSEERRVGKECVRTCRSRW